LADAFTALFLALADPAFFAAQRFLSAATMAARPAALSFRLAFLGAGSDFVSAFCAAHLFRCASAIALRPATLMPPFLRAGGFGLARTVSIRKQTAQLCNLRVESSFLLLEAEDGGVHEFLG
jgi:hypothetical protein